MNATDLYAQAYYAHYTQRDFQRALHLYDQIQAQFPGTAEAGYSATQARDLRGANANAYFPAGTSMPAGASSSPQPGQAAQSFNVSGKFAFWFIVVASAILCVVIYAKASSNGPGESEEARQERESFETQRTAFKVWRASHLPGGPFASPNGYETDGCTFGAVSKAEGNSGGSGMALDVSLNITAGGDPLSGHVVFVPHKAGTGWRCDRGTFRNASSEPISACPPISAWCKDY